MYLLVKKACSLETTKYIKRSQRLRIAGLLVDKHHFATITNHFL